jgi:hypothetical protein
MRQTPPTLVRVLSLSLMALASVALAACDMVPSPEHQSEAARKAAEHTQLRDAIGHKSELDRAKHAADPVLDADKKHDASIDDAGG